jgi:diadenosine tetraphosphate (Ap4A) HIT family hydrolase
MTTDGCAVCRGAELESELGREQVGEDDLWRLTTSIGPRDPTPGFSYLEPKRHISYITEVDGQESSTLGSVLDRCCSALKEAAEAECVYIRVFGDSVPHLHLQLAPRKTGDALGGSPHPRRCSGIAPSHLAHRHVPPSREASPTTGSP